MRSLTLLTCALAGLAMGQVVDKKKTTTVLSMSATSVPSSCSATAIATPTPSVTCGKSGTLKKPAYLGGMFSEGSLSACAGECAIIEGCNSFSFDLDANTCQLYSVTLENMKFSKVKYDGSLFYDDGCFGCAPSPSTSSSSASSTSSSSSSSKSSSSSSTSSSSSSSSVTSLSSTSSSSSSSSTSAPFTNSTTSTSTTFTTVTSTNSSSSSTPTPTSPTTTTSSASTTSSSMSTTASPTLNCASSSVTVYTSTYTDIYTAYYSGPGYTENPTNPGNTTYLPQTYELGYTDACTAIQDCADMADYGYTHFFESFDVHYISSSNTWECVTYHGKNSNASYFNVANSTISEAYGFSFV